MHHPTTESISNPWDDNRDSKENPEARAFVPRPATQNSPEDVQGRELHEEGRLAAEFLARYRDAGQYLRDNVEHLTLSATCGDDDLREGRATEALFGSLVEGLCDSFEPDSVGLYIRVMAQIIQYCRRLDDDLDDELAAFGLATEQDLVDRGERLRPAPGSSALLATGGWLQDPNRIAMVIIPSRVTIGADIAITSVLIERLKQKFPEAALILAGAVKTREIFGGNARLFFAEHEYGRRATLMGRFGCWVDLLHTVRDATRGLQPDEFLVVDPDSRLTQLGMLPLAPDENYLLFPSREYMASSRESLASLASDWSGQVFGMGIDVQLPAITMMPGDASIGHAAIAALGGGGSRPVVSVNFGVGENDKKQVGEEFELAILDFLLGTGAIVILDRGAGSSEKRRTDSLVARLASKRAAENASGEPELGSGEHKMPSCGTAGLEVDEAGLKAILQGTPAEVDLLVFNGRVGLLAGLIAASDLYIGYDSAGQHIAAAAGTACIDVFAGYSSPRMLDRWRPTGAGKSTVIDAGRGRSIAEIAEEVKAAASRALEDLSRAKS
jgi:hypothetical protein